MLPPVARILLSESDPDVRRLLTLLLERIGHEVVVLDARLGAAPPADLMVLEPASQLGLDHARLARAAQPELPILCVSVLPDDAQFLELGPLSYLAKPFALDALCSAVDRTLALAVGAA
jgi:DNA-binding response OmpR family regulator